MNLTKEHITSERVRVDLTHIGEGYFGEYDPENPSDKRLLRFDVYTRKTKKRWEALDDGSYCTNIPVDTPEDDLKWVLLYICASVIDEMERGGSLKKLCERLSWIMPNAVEITKFKLGNLLMKEYENASR